MVIADLYSIPKLVIADITDLYSLLTKPRELFKKISSETPEATIRRLLLYGILFDFLFVILLVPTFPEVAIISFQKVFFISVLETIIAIVFGFILYFPTRVLRPAPKMRVVVACAVMLKFVMLAPAMVFYAIYLFTESVVIGALKGATAWIAIVTIPLLCPFLVSPSKKRRLLSAILALFLIFALNLTVGWFIVDEGKYLHNKIIRLSILYDPIASELDKMQVKSLLIPFDLSPILVAHGNILKSFTIRDNSVTMDVRMVSRNMESLKKQATTILQYSAGKQANLDLVSKDLRFGISKAIAADARVTLKVLNDLANRTEGLSIQTLGDFGAYIEWSTKTTELIKSYQEKQKALNQEVFVAVYPRLKLRQLLLEIW